MTTPTAADLFLEEKAALLTGHDFWSTEPLDRVGVPSVVLTDGPHGVRLQAGSADHLGLSSSLPATCFPPAVAVGCSWDPTVAERIGAAVGQEARSLGVQVVLGPGINIKRSPLCGRNVEYYSEYPLLSGVLGAAHVRGQQSVGVGASLKHFAANNQETDRMRVSAEVDERTLREIYLPAFERVVTEADPATVMCAYNKVHGVPASENPWLLTEILREQWGFAGAVVSDWGAVQDPVASLRAGLDLQMPGTSGRSARALIDAVRAGDLDEQLLDDAVERVLALVRRTTSHEDPAADVDVDHHHDLARTLAAQCAVLLKNDRQTLPLRDGLRLAVIGAFADDPRIQGGGSSRVNATRVDTPLGAMRALAGQHGCDLSYAPGWSTDGAVDAAAREEALDAARSADVCVVFAGLPESAESEGFDRTTLDLPGDQVELVRAVAAVASRTVVVLANGGVVSLEGWHDEVDAILEGFLLGQGGGGAVADLLFGIANPSGRLAETIPVRLQDTASYVNFPGEQGSVRYGEGVMVGYRWHETVGIPARYPFGHGLSYTTFETTGLAVTATGSDSAVATLTVTNTGDRAGADVVQVYVATDAGPVRRPARELRAFSKVHLEPGESRDCTFELGRRAFACWNVERSDWVVSPGSYAVQVCRDAASLLLEQDVVLDGDTLVRELTLGSTVDEWCTHPAVGPALLELLASAAASGGDAPALTPDLLRMVGSMPMQKVVDMLGDAVPASTLDLLVARSRGAVDAPVAPSIDKDRR